MSEYKYQSPIEMIQGKMKMHMDDEILKAVQDVGVVVDRNELLKALAYDRDQYNKGYHDAEPKVGKWIRTGRTNVYGGEELMCPFCGDRVMVQNIEYELYCRQCGALLGDRTKGEADE